MNTCYASEFIGKQVAVNDGEIGLCVDLLLDKKSWALAYFVIDAHPWLPANHKVVMAPEMLDTEYFAPEQCLLFKTCKQQIQAAPTLVDGQTITEQLRHPLFQYVGYAGFWNQPSLLRDIPNDFCLLPEYESIELSEAEQMHSHLYSFKELMHFQLMDDEQALGRLVDIEFALPRWQALALEFGAIPTSDVREPYGARCKLSPETVAQVSCPNKTLQASAAA